MNNNKDEKFLVLRGISEKLGRNYERTYGVSVYSKTDEFYPDDLKLRQSLRTTTYGIRTENVQEYKTMFAVNELNFKRLVIFFGKYYIKDSFYISRNDSVTNIEWDILLSIPSFEIVEKDIFSGSLAEDECLVIGERFNHCALSEYIETLKTMNVLNKKFIIDECENESDD